MYSSTEPLVTRIRVEYADGGCDEVSLLQAGGFPLYDLCRIRAEADVRRLGAHSAGAIASILFRTAATAQRTEYPFHDPKMAAVIGKYFEEPQSQKISEAVREIPTGAAKRRWTLRADNHSHHHGIVRLSECPLYLELHWRPTSVDSTRRVGIFRLDLAGLLRGGYIRPEPANSHGPDVRLRILLADDGGFYVQAHRDGPRILLSKEPRDESCNSIPAPDGNSTP